MNLSRRKFFRAAAGVVALPFIPLRSAVGFAASDINVQLDMLNAFTLRAGEVNFATWRYFYSGILPKARKKER